MENVSLNFFGLSKFLAVVAITLLAACTQNTGTVDTALNQQPGSAETTTTSENALTAEANQAAAQNATEAQLQQTAPTSTEGVAEQTQVAAIDTSNAMTFLPVEGAPQSAITDLSKSLRASAQEYGLAILPPTQTGAKYQVKGYFSALNDGSSTLLVYVWDVVDQSGKRVHRINGQERSSSSNTDPWLAISDKELERVADRTTSRLKSWVDSKKG
ncbi:MAG: hypothetical protein QNJ29_06675 [Rhizobiaceae bacterium]|nr:hypothetical protein [Rhizobiaceae bacterium]